MNLIIICLTLLFQLVMILNALNCFCMVCIFHRYRLTFCGKSDSPMFLESALRIFVLKLALEQPFQGTVLYICHSNVMQLKYFNFVILFWFIPLYWNTNTNTVTHNTAILHSKVLHVSVHQIHHQAHLLQKVKYTGTFCNIKFLVFMRDD
jgi:hypothetical protein